MQDSSCIQNHLLTSPHNESANWLKIELHHSVDIYLLKCAKAYRQIVSIRIRQLWFYGLLTFVLCVINTSIKSLSRQAVVWLYMFKSANWMISFREQAEILWSQSLISLFNCLNFSTLREESCVYKWREREREAEKNEWVKLDRDKVTIFMANVMQRHQLSSRACMKDFMHVCMYVYDVWLDSNKQYIITIVVHTQKHARRTWACTANI